MDGACSLLDLLLAPRVGSSRKHDELWMDGWLLVELTFAKWKGTGGEGTCWVIVILGARPKEVTIDRSRSGGWKGW